MTHNESLANLAALRIDIPCDYIDLPMQQAMQKIEDEYKDDYIRPNLVPYNQNMARQFTCNKYESEEEQQKKREQAEASRLSRDKNKFFRHRMKMDIHMLTNLLHENAGRLVNLECFANEILKTSGLPPIDWAEVWDDDASISFVQDTDDEDDDKEEEDTDDEMTYFWDDENDAYDDVSGGITSGASSGESYKTSDEEFSYDDQDGYFNDQRIYMDEYDYEHCFMEPDITITHPGDLATIYESSEDNFINSGEDSEQ